MGSLRPIRTARETLGGRTLERPSCGGLPTAETTLFPAYSARSRRLLASSVRLDNEPILTDLQTKRANESSRRLRTELMGLDSLAVEFK